MTPLQAALQTDSGRISGSYAKRRMECVPSMALERLVRFVLDPQGDDASFAAARGTALHEAISDLLIKGEHATEYGGYRVTTNDEMDGIAPAMDAVRELVREAGGEADFESEIAVTGEVGGVQSRAFVDFAAVTDDTLIVADFKFGFRPVTDMTQVMFYAYLLRQARPDLRNADRVLVAYIQPALDYPLTMRDVSAAELDDFGARVEEAVVRGVALETAVVDRGDVSENVLAELDTRPGDHCQYCLAKPICPSHRSALAEVPPTLPPMIEDAELGDLLRKCTLVGDLEKDVRKYAANAIEQGRTIPGYSLAPKRGARVWTDPEAAEKLLRRKIGAKQTFPKAMLSPAQAEKVMGKVAYLRFADKHVAMLSSGTRLVATRGKNDDVRERLAAALKGDA